MWACDGGARGGGVRVMAVCVVVVGVVCVCGGVRVWWCECGVRVNVVPFLLCEIETE